MLKALKVSRNIEVKPENLENCFFLPLQWDSAIEWTVTQDSFSKFQTWSGSSTKNVENILL